MQCQYNSNKFNKISGLNLNEPGKNKYSKPWYPSLNTYNVPNITNMASMHDMLNIPYDYNYNFYMNYLMWNYYKYNNYHNNYNTQMYYSEINSNKKTNNHNNNSISNKHIGTYFVQIEQEKYFNVVNRIIGNSGEKLKFIINNFSEYDFDSHKLKIRLTGKGSNFKDRYSNTSNNEHDDLKLYVSSINSSVFDSACCMIENLLSEIYSEYREFLIERNESLATCPKEFKMSYKLLKSFNNNINDNNNDVKVYT
jgi:hypothetical protein